MSTFVLAAALLFGCDREQRRLREVGPAVQRSGGVVMSPLQPGAPAPRGVPPIDYQGNAYAIGEGYRLFNWFNCVGCHANGGGGMGPALIDADWIYGSEPEQIFSTIVEGRPNGMPSFRGRIADYQVWQLAAYVRAMAGMVPPDAVPGRPEHMSGPPSGVLLPGDAPAREPARHP
jgi:cytochrome c oxidase cbb3-type subunit 3